MSGPMYSFRVTSPTVRALLDKLPHRSRFIREAVTERLLGEAVGASGGPAPDMADESPDARVAELRSGLAAISEAGTALMARSGTDLPADLRAGLVGICEAAAELARDSAQAALPRDPEASPAERQDAQRDPDADPCLASDTPSSRPSQSNKDTQS